jgi:ABC-type Mn2+/Zn2+ transport system ATPase subunit
MEPVVEVENLNLIIEGRHILKNVSFQVNKGEVLPYLVVAEAVKLPSPSA